MPPTDSTSVNGILRRIARSSSQTATTTPTVNAPPLVRAVKIQPYRSMGGVSDGLVARLVGPVFRHQRSLIAHDLGTHALYQVFRRREARRDTDMRGPVKVLYCQFIGVLNVHRVGVVMATERRKLHRVCAGAAADDEHQVDLFSQLERVVLPVLYGPADRIDDLHFLAHEDQFVHDLAAEFERMGGLEDDADLPQQPMGGFGLTQLLHAVYHQRRVL